MPFSLYVHRTDKREDELSPVDFEQALNIFGSIPWEEDVSVWETVPDETSEEHRPLFTVFDDAGCAIAITPYSDDLLAFAYEYPQRRSRFGSVDEPERVGTDQFPRAKVALLLSAFFDGDRDTILQFIERYPMQSAP
jgi:hypothetical protein